MKPDWYYDDLTQVGLDFAEDAQVASYDARQKGDAAGARALLQGLELKTGQRYADIGCGTGLLAVEAAKLGAEVTAIDISPAMLKAAQGRAGDTGVTIQTLHAGFLSLPDDLGGFDLVTSCFAFHHLPDFWKAEALMRLKTHISPEGRFFLRDVVFSCPPQEIASAVESWARYLSDHTGYGRDELAVHLRAEHSTFDWILEGLLERAGYRILTSKKTPPVYADYLCQPLA